MGRQDGVGGGADPDTRGACAPRAIKLAVLGGDLGRTQNPAGGISTVILSMQCFVISMVVINIKTM
jgi:hypothetical protein